MTLNPDESTLAQVNTIIGEIGVGRKDLYSIDTGAPAATASKLADVLASLGGLEIMVVPLLARRIDELEETCRGLAARLDDS